MEHFFLEDQFYHELGDLIDDLFPENGDIEALEADWSIRVQESKLEPMFKVDRDEINAVLMNYFLDKHEDRFSQDNDDQENYIDSALHDCVNVDQLNRSIPELYYPTTYTMITKQDLLDYLND